jgi:branched-chain amino acid transport system ATP-binding protein
MIETRDLTKNFGGLKAVNKLNIKVEKGEIVGLIGPNGSGKTTVFNLLTGFLKPTSGQILFEGKDISRKSPNARAKLGISRTFQIVKVFRDFSVSRNMAAASHLYPRISFWEAVFFTRGYRRKEDQIKNDMMQTLQFLGLDRMKDEIARNLPHGYQQLLGIAMALATRAKLLLLDEPLAGLSPAEVNRALEIIGELRRQGKTIILIEHNMAAAMGICDRFVVLNFGTQISGGSPDEVSRDPNVIQAYLGVGANVA